MSKPVETFRAGAIQVAIFETEFEKNGKSQKMYNTSVSRSYKQGDEWKHTSSLGRDDIPKAIMLLNKAYDYIFSLGSSSQNDNKQDVSPF